MALPAGIFGKFWSAGGHGCTKDCGGAPQPLGLLEATQAGEALGGGAA